MSPLSFSAPKSSWSPAMIISMIASFELKVNNVNHLNILTKKSTSLHIGLRRLLEFDHMKRNYNEIIMAYIHLKKTQKTWTRVG